MGTTERLVRNSAGSGNASALRFAGAGYSYPGENRPALRAVDLRVHPGEIVAVMGGNGSGKTTLARLANGLLQPDEGLVEVGGMRTDDPAVRPNICARVGLVFQNPDDQIVGATVADDVAFGLENLGVPRPEMQERVAAALADLDLAAEAGTEPHLLSGGQRQRLALAAVLVLEPSVLILDEPTSMLDHRGRREVIRLVRRMTDRGIGVVFVTQLAEETLPADRLYVLSGGRMGWEGRPDQFFRSEEVRRYPLGLPPVMTFSLELARALKLGAEEENRASGLRPWLAPLVARLGRKATAPLDEAALTRALLELGAAPAIPPSEPPLSGAPPMREAPDAEAAAEPGSDNAAEPEPDPAAEPEPDPAASRPAKSPAPALVSLRRAGVVYNPRMPMAREALDAISLDLRPRAITAVIGGTAAGKSTLLQLIAGLLPPTSGTVSTLRRGDIGMVFQRPEFQLFAATVEADIAVAPRMAGLSDARVEQRVAAAMEAVGLDAFYRRRSPHALSLGEQRRVALAGVLSLDPLLLILDEPGAGLDPQGRTRLMRHLLGWRKGERALLFTSHDLEEVARVADRVVLLKKGRVAAEGPTAEVLANVELTERSDLQPPLAARLASGWGGTDVSGDRRTIASPGPVTAAGLAGLLISGGPGRAPGQAAGSADDEPRAGGSSR